MFASLAKRSSYHPIEEEEGEGDHPLRSAKAQNDGDEEEEQHGVMGESALPPSVSFKCEKDPEKSAGGQDGGRAHQWDHVGDVDQFFAFIYEYYLNKGFLCIALRCAFSLFRFAFVVLFSTFLLQCIDYDVLFYNRNTAWDGSQLPTKRRIHDAILPQCPMRLHPLVQLTLCLAFLFWLWQLLRICYRLVQFYRIKQFFAVELHISDEDMMNVTWAQVVAQLCQAQQRIQLIVNKRSIDSLDIYQRILRHKNYFVAMVYKSLLPPQLPLGPGVFYLSSGLRFNLEWLLFWGPWSPWKSSYALKDEFRDRENLERIAQSMRRTVTVMAAANLVLSPFILIYQVLFSFFSYSELFRRDPNTFGMRKYSNYGREKLRHFNEMDHELDARLNRSHEFAVRYTDQFVSPVGKIVAKNIAFVAASIFVVLLALTAFDEDTLKIEHITTIMTVAGGVALACGVFIPNEHMVLCQQQLMQQIVAFIHYAPRAWLAKAHSTEVYADFARIFRLRAVLLAEELVSPLVTPLVLYIYIRPRVADIVAFLHKYTVHVDGLGDVCSLAQMDISRDGDSRLASVNQSLVAKDGLEPKHSRNKYGKVELSLLNFATQNPDWVPSKQCAEFIRNMKELVQNEILLVGGGNDDSPASTYLTMSSSMASQPQTTTIPSESAMTAVEQQNLPDTSSTMDPHDHEPLAPPPPPLSFSTTTATADHRRESNKMASSSAAMMSSQQRRRRHLLLSDQQQQQMMMVASSFIQPPSLAGAIVQPSLVQESNFRAMEMSLQALAVNRLLFQNTNAPTESMRFHAGLGGYGSILTGSTARRGVDNSMAESNLFGVPAVEASQMVMMRDREQL